jgi:F5/8 type C domain/Beta-1,3-glucanase
MHRPTRRAALAAAAVLLTGSISIALPQATAAPALLSQGKPATASSVENGGTPASAAFDGNTGTRWSSAFSDPQWLQVDLGAPATITQVTLQWEAAYARSFQIQVSDTGNGGWTSIFGTTTGAGGTQTLTVNGHGRFVRMYGTARATPWGYSLWEFQVFGSFDTSGCGTGNAALNHPATASSVENAGTPASAAFDGNTGTRWSSQFSDPQWIQVDLGAAQSICQVVLSWEAAYARAFQVQVSADGSAWTDVYSTTSGAGGTQTLNVTGTGRYVRMYGTARATPWGYSLWEFAVRVPGTSSDPFWGDTSTIPPAQNVLMVKVLNRTNGRYPDSQVYWSFNGQVHSIAEQPYLDMPANSAGRMYFSLGSPTSQYNDFIEFTVGPSVFNGNTTRVDAFAVKLAMRLHAHDGYDVSVGEDLATFQEDRAVTFQRFMDEVPAEFDHLAQIQAPYRIPAPGSSPNFRPGGVNANYFTAYAASVGSSATTQEIFGCSGPLANDPTKCAGLNRHVAHLPSPDWSDPAKYYLAAPANYYARFWHDHAINRLAYGFPYDDYAGQSSFISHGNPQYLLVAVGW